MLLRAPGASTTAHFARCEQALFEAGAPARDAHALACLLLEKASQLAPGYAPHDR